MEGLFKYGFKGKYYRSELASCPNYGVEVKPLKEWTYGPKGGRPTFQVYAFECPKCGLKFRNYLQAGQVKFTLALKEGRFRKVR